MNDPPDWFWRVLDSARPSLRRLADWLESATQQEIEDYAVSFRNAAEDITNYWDGPEGYSEDSTEDLCTWTVSQGEVLWRKAVTREISLEELVRIYEQVETGQESRYSNWIREETLNAYMGYLSPTGLPMIIYEQRFGADLYDRLDELE